MAPTGDVLFWTFVILGLLITLAGYQLLATALLSRAVARSRAALTRRPVVSGLAGAATLLVTIGLFAGLKSLGQGGTLVGLAGIVAVSTLAVCGLAAFSRLVGERLPSAIDATSPWRPTLRGAITAELAFTFPFVGWMLFGLTLLVAGGAGVLGATGLHALAGRLRRSGSSGPDSPDAAPSVEPLPPVAVRPVRDEVTA